MRIEECGYNDWLPGEHDQLVMEARDKDERDFFEMIGNYLLQKKQKQAIEGNLF